MSMWGLLKLRYLQLTRVWSHDPRLSWGGLTSWSSSYWPFHAIFFGRDARRVQRGALPLYLVGLSQSVEQCPMQEIPNARLLPFLEASPAGHAGTASHLHWEHLPGDAT